MLRIEVCNKDNELLKDPILNKDSLYLVYDRDKCVGYYDLRKDDEVDLDVLNLIDTIYKEDELVHLFYICATEKGYGGKIVAALMQYHQIDIIVGENSHEVSKFWDKLGAEQLSEYDEITEMSWFKLVK